MIDKWFLKDKVAGTRLVNKCTGEIDTKHNFLQYVEAIKKYTYQRSYYLGAKNTKAEAKLDAKLHYFYTHRRFAQLNLNVYQELTANFISSKEASIVSTLFQKVNRNTNKTKITYYDLAQFNYVSYPTIARILKSLKSSSYFKISHGCVFISPMLISETDEQGFDAIYKDYHYTSCDWWNHLNSNDEYTIHGRRY